MSLRTFAIYRRLRALHLGPCTAMRLARAAARLSTNPPTKETTP